MAARALWIAASLAACGRVRFDATNDGPPPFDPNDGEHSGTRLKLKWWEMPDGTRERAGIFDAQRAEDCSFVAWADGATHCVPSATGQLAYRDAACSQPIGYDPYSPLGCAGPQYFSDGVVCAQPRHLYARGADLASGMQYYLSFPGGTCVGPFTSGVTTKLTAIGAEVPVSALATVTLGPPVGSGRIGTNWYSSSDGFLLQGGLEDLQLGKPCTFTSYDDAMICQPEASYAIYARDAQCTQPLAGNSAGCGPGDVIATRAPNACTRDEPSWFAVGATVGPPAQLYQWNAANGSCVTTTSTGLTLWSLGAPLTLAPATQTPDAVAGHRLVPVHDHADGASYREQALYDTELATTCATELADDGAMRCLPFASQSIAFFTDSSCTLPIDVVLVPGDVGCAPRPAPSYGAKFISPGICTSPTEIHAIGAAYTGLLYSGPANSCTLYAGPAGTTYYQLGAKLPASMFAPATPGKDP